jgi:hypothetical protein
MYSAGLLVTAITNWLGVGALRRLKVRFAAKAWPGEVLSSRVRITATRSDNGALLVDFELHPFRRRRDAQDPRLGDRSTVARHQHGLQRKDT